MKAAVAWIYAAIIVLVIVVVIALAFVAVRFGLLPSVMSRINDALHIWG